ncbi:MAG: glycosyltransferase, partial [Acidimicrobiia bacterium]|nr:glycosyltransferase [Acidimicrobiia bacterium]
MSVPTRPVSGAASTEQANVVAAISVRAVDRLASVLDAVHKQVYEPGAIVVVGGGEAARVAATGFSVQWVPDLRSLLDGLDREITHVWLLHDDTAPRPDAFKALVDEAMRVDASVAGSKLLDAEHPEFLESVGGATDVFGMPHTGLEKGEVDQEQYDVVRDVAFAPGASVLVRRDLLRGLGGSDATLPPLEAGIDFSQRARAAGGRVVVVPSSEVLHASTCGADDAQWRSRAGRIRSALKVYSLLTLVWLIPIGAIIDLVDGLVRIVVGPRLSIVGIFRAWGWNLVNLPSTLAARKVVNQSRQVGDAELFRPFWRQG